MRRRERKLTLSELRDFAKRMGGDVPVVAYDGHRRVEIQDMMAERTATGETLVLVLSDPKEVKRDA